MAFAALSTSVVPSNTGNVRQCTSTEAIAAGLVVRTTTGDKCEIANSGAAATDDVLGIAVSETNAAGQPIIVALPSTLLTGLSGLTPGQTYYLGNGANEGQVGLFTDASTASALATVVGVAVSATSLYILPYASGVQL